MDVGYWVQEPDVSSPDSAEYGPRRREVALELDVHWGRRGILREHQHIAIF